MQRHSFPAHDTMMRKLSFGHDLGVVAKVADYVNVTYAGKIIEVGNVEEIFSNQIHPYTKSLISAIPHLNPMVEKRRIAITYDYATSGIDYAKGTEHVVNGTHKVLATDEEYAAWTMP